MIQPGLAWQLACKDLRLFLADRRGVLLCLGVPILLASAFGAIFHRPDEGETIRPAVWVVNEGGAEAGGLVEELCKSDKLHASACDADTARRRLASESGVVIVLPAGMADPTQRDRQPTVRLWHHPRDHLPARWVEGVLTEVVMRHRARRLLAPLGRLGEGIRLERPFVVEHECVPQGGALSVNAYSHSFCGMTLQYLLFWGMDSGLLLLRERRGGLWLRLRAAPLTRGTLLAGKALATALVALAQVAAVFAFGALVFGVAVTGSPAGFVLMALAAALLSAATGLGVAAVGGTEGRARSVAILVILTLSLLGGLWLPAFLLPDWAQRLALCLPTTWAARGLEGVTWQGMGLAEAAGCAAVLAGFSVVFLALAWWRLARAEPA